MSVAVAGGCQLAPEPVPEANGVGAASPSGAGSAQATLEPIYDVDVETVAESVHRKLDCSDCHATVGDHGAAPADASCSRCHARAAESHASGIHARTRDGGLAATCLDCHGAHDIYGSDDPRSRMHRLRASQTCARCHGDPELAMYLGMKQSDAAAQYKESIHGKALLEGRLTVAPSCVDCHEGHDMQRTSRERASVNPRNVSATCGRCHEGVERRLAASVHSNSGAEPDAEVVSCVSCHSAHSIQPSGPASKLAADRRCGSCHQAELASHLDTYHGRAHALGSSDVAACYDCHGHHEIVPVQSASSPVAPANLQATCQNCHHDAPAGLTQYFAHGNRRDAERFPALHYAYKGMTYLLSALFGIFALHALSWSARTAVEYARDPARFRARRSERLANAIERPLLRRVDWFCYVSLMMCVAALVATGLPLKYPLHRWARLGFDLLGGPTVARTLHRGAALGAMLVVAIHLTTLLVALWRSRFRLADEAGRVSASRLLRAATASASPWFGLRDLRALLAHTKWFVGRAKEPTFGRFTYWEKLDYAAGTFSLAVLAASGIMLWFPEVVAQVAPGYVLNLAQIVHSEQALLAVGSALTYHVFHVVILNRLLVPDRARTSLPPEPEPPA